MPYPARALLLLAFACHAPDDVDDPGRHPTDGPGHPHTDEPVSDDATPPALVVPKPVVLELTEERYVLETDAVIRATSGAKDTAALLAAALRPSTGLDLPIVSADATGSGIDLVLDDTLALPDEGYTLDVDASGVTIAAADEDGLFWGTQTLRQLLWPAALGDRASSATWTLAGVHVEDAPAFAWRGLMIDVARHFFTIGALERQIDVMALHKLNRLHLHLTDDQGWRIEIRSWPRLTEVGGATEVGGGEGGFYTQAELRGLIAYASARHVTVVPEVDFPGHANAALSSYAELNEGGVAAAPYRGKSVISTPLWLEGEATSAFVADVWSEVAALTPGPWVHAGGDEAVDLDVADYAAFVRQLQAVIAGQGKTMIAWDEVADAELSAPFVAQHWISEDRARDAVDQGAGLIASPAERAYLDMVHDEDATFGQTWSGPIDVERAYDWDPAPPRVDARAVLGVEGTLFTEQINSVARMDLMLWPRAAALAEVGWTPRDAREWTDFRERAAWHGARLEALGVGYYRSPEIAWTALDEAR